MKSARSDRFGSGGVDRIVDAPETRPPPLTDAELRGLLARLDHGLGRTAQGFKTSMVSVALMFVVLALFAGSRSMHAEAIVSACMAVGMVVLGVVAARRNAPARMRPVLVAVRDAPEQVVRVKHSTTSDSRQLFVIHWIRIATADAELLVKANEDWSQLVRLLARRCPLAIVEPGPRA